MGKFRATGRRAFIAFIFLISRAPSFAQASPTPSPAPTAAAQASPAPAATPLPEPKTGQLTDDTLPLDISTAGIYELAAWCRSLGLPESGTVEELRARLYDRYKVKAPAEAAGSGRTIEIRSAREAEYFTIENDGDTMVKLSGGVLIVMTESKRNWTHEIRARTVTYNQTLNLLSARGDVKYKLVKPEGEEYFYGEALDVDLATWTGTFLDGRVVRSTTGSGLEKKFTFSAKAIEKGEGDVSVFSDAVISSCPDYDHPHYSIRASKAWILGKSEWGLYNAVLSVGEVPVLYLPFFYYTGEEIYFHPVIGTRKREGYFANATIYLLGEKKPSKESISLLQLNSQETGMEKRLVGVYMLTTDKKKDKANNDLFKVMLDAYSNLGVLAGLECALSSNKDLPTLNLSCVAALTRNVYAVTGTNGALTYSPLADANGWESVWNGADVFGRRWPIRFGMELGSSYQPPKSGLTFTLAFPYYTDPYIEQDSDIRSEDMKWFQFLENSSSTSSTTTTESRREQLEMKAEAVYSPPDLGFLKPYVNALSVSYLRTKLSSKSKAALKNDGSAYDSVDPARYFFAPEQWTIAESSATLSGTVLSYPKAAAAAPAPGASAPGSAGDALPPPRSPWYEEKKAAPEGAKGSAGGSGSAADSEDLSPSYRQSAVKVEGGGGATSREPFAFSLGYELTPSGSMERVFNSAPWKNGEDVDWATLYDRRYLKLGSSAKAQASFFGSLFIANAALSYTLQRQEHVNFNAAAAANTATAIANYRLGDYNALQDKLGGTLGLTSNPLQDIPLFSSSSLAYKLECVFLNKKYSSLDPTTGEPIYVVKAIDWKSGETVPTHNLALTLGAKPMGWNETLTLTANLPPLAESYAAALSLKLWDGSFSSSFRRYRDTAAGPWKYEDLKFTGAYAFLPKLSLSDSFSYDLNEGRPSANTLNLTAWDFSAALTHSWGYDLAFRNHAWQEITTKEDGSSAIGFQLSTLTMNYASALDPIYLWKNRIMVKPGLTSNLNINFLKYTTSSFTFAPTLALTINDFLELNFSSTSQNTKVYKYLVGLPGFDTNLAITRMNPLIDLLDSFAFWDTDARTASNFKLKGIKATAVHHMDDWDLSLSFEGKSELNSTSTQYVFNPYFTLSLAWKQIPEIKTDIAKNPTSFSVK